MSFGNTGAETGDHSLLKTAVHFQRDLYCREANHLKTYWLGFASMSAQKTITQTYVWQTVRKKGTKAITVAAAPLKCSDI